MLDGSMRWNLKYWTRSIGETLGSFNINDGDGGENVTFKMNFAAFIPVNRKCQM